MMEEKVFFAFSDKFDFQEALREVSLQIKSQKKTSHLDLCLVFSNFFQGRTRIFSELKYLLDFSELVVIFTPHFIWDTHLPYQAIGMVGFSNLNFKLGMMKDWKNLDLEEVGEKFSRNFLKPPASKPRNFFLNFFSLPPLSSFQFLKGLERGLGRSSPILGTCFYKDSPFSGEAPLFIYKEEVFNTGAVGVLFFKDLEANFGFTSGFNPVGKGGIVTSWEKYNLKQIDHKPPLDFYRQYFGDKVSSPSSLKKITQFYPLGFSGEEKNFLLRTTWKLNSDGSFFLLEDAGSQEVRLMISTQESLIDSAYNLCKKLKSGIRRARIAIMFENEVRFKLLGAFYRKQLQKMKDVLGEIPLLGVVGTYNFGPFSSGRTQIKNFVQENSLALLILGD